MKYFLYLLVFAIFTSCETSKKTPDVSGIKIDISLERFEEDFIKIDTNNIEIELDALQKKYPSFTVDYLYNILGNTPQKDSTIKYVALFLKDNAYTQVNKDASLLYKDFNKYKKEIIEALKYVKHYFPTYNIPKKIITFVGPLDGVGTALTSSHDIAIGLQVFLGADYPAYQSSYIREIYPTYQTRKFTSAYITTSVVKNIIEEMYPYKFNGRPLIEQMVEKGKRLYAINALMPNAADTVKIGYTNNQLSECTKNEAYIFSFFVQNNLLFEREPSIVMPFITDGPKTQELSETAPGNIGSFVGWKIVNSWMKKNKEKTVEQLMKTPATTIFNEANYKP